MAERQTSLLQKKRTDVPGQTGQSSAFGNGLRSAGTSEGLKLIDEGIAGLSDAAGLEARAEILEFNAKQETLRGQQESLSALESLNDIQAANIVAAAASGIRLQGSVVRAQEEVGRRAAFSTAISTTNAAIRAGALKREAKRLRAEEEYNRRIAPLKIIKGAQLTFFSVTA